MEAGHELEDKCKNETYDAYLEHDQDITQVLENVLFEAHNLEVGPEVWELWWLLTQSVHDLHD